MSKKVDVNIVGGGMITQVQVLPSVYQIKRGGQIGDINVCALNAAPLKTLAETKWINDSFPGMSFNAYPDYTTGDLNEAHPELFKEVLEKTGPGSITIVALPDQLHYSAIKEALLKDQHVITVKPLVLKYAEAKELEDLAYERGLFLGVEYHKRADGRALMARKDYRAGKFGEFMVGHATLHEPWYYRDSNFQNWCTCENSDMFSYVGCHYVDQVHFITGMMPTEVSVYGIKDKYPNGNEGYLYTDARVIWENGACLNVQNGMGYPDIAPGGNAQGLKMLMKGENEGALLFHDDQYRGIKYSQITKGDDAGDTFYSEPSPDYMKMVEYGGEGLEPIGYGYMSIKRLADAALMISQIDDLSERQAKLKAIDEAGILATAANSSFNELVMEAGRLSILNDGKPAVITYGDNPSVSLK